MSKAFGDILMKLRQERGFNQEELCKGLCSSATLSRLESGDRDPDYLLFDALMTRLGKDSLKWEIILKPKDRELLQKRNRMEYLLGIRNLKHLENELEQYKICSDISTNLHEQYLFLIEGNIAFERGNYELAAQKYHEALKKTDRDINFNKIKIENTYSRNELRILCSLGRTIIQLDTITNKIKSDYAQQLKHYIEKQCTDEWYRLHNYVMVLYTISYLNYKQNDFMESFVYCKKAIIELMEKRSSFYLKEFLILVEQLRQQGLGELAIQSLGMERIPYFIEILEEWSIENQMVDIKDVESYSYQSMATASEIIRNTRSCLGKKQEDIMFSKDGTQVLIDQSGLSKIENGKREPRKELLQHCFEQLELGGKDNRYSLPLKDENFEIQELRWEIDYYISIQKKELAEPLFEILKKQIDNDNVYNQQYMKKVEIILNKEKKQIPADVCVKTLLEALKLTVPNIKSILNKKEEWGYYFTQQELLLLLNIGAIYHNQGNHMEALKYYEGLESHYQHFYILSDRKIYKAILQNLSSIYGLMGEYEKSIEKSEKCLFLDSMSKEMNKKHRAIYNIAWCYHEKSKILEQKQDKIYCQQQSSKYFEQAKYLATIYGDQVVIEYLQKYIK